MTEEEAVERIKSEFPDSFVSNLSGFIPIYNDNDQMIDYFYGYNFYINHKDYCWSFLIKHPIKKIIINKCIKDAKNAFARIDWK